MAKAWKVEGIKPKKSYRWNAAVILPVKVEEVYAWAEYIHHPDNIRELHNMRISIKRLRYSMEFFAINYGKAFDDFLQVWVDLQELVGEIHDCDIIQDVLTGYLQNLREDANADAIGINALILRYREIRKTKYHALLLQWDELEQTDFKGRLLETINQSK